MTGHKEASSLSDDMRTVWRIRIQWGGETCAYAGVTAKAFPRHGWLGCLRHRPDPTLHQWLFSSAQ